MNYSCLNQNWLPRGDYSVVQLQDVEKHNRLPLKLPQRQQGQCFPSLSLCDTDSPKKGFPGRGWGLRGWGLRAWAGVLSGAPRVAELTASGAPSGAGSGARAG